MRFAVAHKTATYLAAACAFFALALSGELGALPVGVGLFGLVASWWFEPPRVRLERWQGPLTALTALLLAWSLVQLVLGGDVLVLGAEFLLYLQVAKLLSRARLKDYLQIYVLSFLMLAAGTVLNSELTFGVFFLGYVVSASWALMVFQLRRELEERHLVPGDGAAPAMARALASRRIVDRRFFTGSALVSLGVFAGAVAMFLVIPRIGFGLFLSKSRGGVSMTGFSDGVRLGGHGTIRNDDTVVMRVVIDGAPTGRGAPARHWRGVAFDQYRNGEWRRTSEAPLTRTQITLAGDGREVHHLLGEGEAPATAADLAARIRGAARQEIYLEPLGYDVLFGASRPLAFAVTPLPRDYRDPERDARRRRNQKNDEFRQPHTVGIKYTVYSALAPPPAAALRAAAGPLPDGHEVYLQVPDEVTERVRARARELTAGAATDYDKLVALERWLETELGYTLDQRAPPPGQEPLDFFLFDRKLGHCEYFASALAIMGRVVGVPTRSVNGFLGGEWNEYDDYVAVRAGDAHSWVEAYFPGHGWVTFDPTPAAESSGLGGGGDGPLDRLRRLTDTLRFKWFKWVIEYDLGRQLALFKRLGGLVRGGASKLVKQRTDAIKAWLVEHRAALAAAVAAVGLVVAALALRRRRRRQDSALLGERRMRGPRPAPTVIYVGVLRRLARRGHRKAASQTPREHARGLRSEPFGAELAELVELHYAAEYGGGDGGELTARARALAAAIRQGTGRRRAGPRPTA
jgi:protein-glutamine gamma-glutamyltransferase